MCSYSGDPVHYLTLLWNFNKLVHASAKCHCHVIHGKDPHWYYGSSFGLNLVIWLICVKNVHSFGFPRYMNDFVLFKCVVKNAQARVTTNPERWCQHCLGLLLMWKVSHVFHVCCFREVGRVLFGSTRCALKAEVRASSSSRTPKGLPPYALFPISRVSLSSLPTASRTLRRRRTRAHLTVL